MYIEFNKGYELTFKRIVYKDTLTYWKRSMRTVQPLINRPTLANIQLRPTMASTTTTVITKRRAIYAGVSMNAGVHHFLSEEKPRNTTFATA